MIAIIPRKAKKKVDISEATPLSSSGVPPYTHYLLEVDKKDLEFFERIGEVYHILDLPVEENEASHPDDVLEEKGLERIQTELT